MNGISYYKITLLKQALRLGGVHCGIFVNDDDEYAATVVIVEDVKESLAQNVSEQ